MENRITGRRPQRIIDGEEEIVTNNPELIKLDSAVDELKAVTQGGLFDYANRGLDAASEERKREQQRKREELDGKSRERDEAARNVNKPTGGDENGNGSGSANSYGKGD